MSINVEWVSSSVGFIMSNEGIAMLKLHIDQFCLPQVHNIHLFNEETDLEKVRSSLSKTAQALNFHLAILEGQEITSHRDLLVWLAQTYQFPKHSDENYERLSWDVANDWLGSLGWMTNPEETSIPVGGFICSILTRCPCSLLIRLSLRFS